MLGGLASKSLPDGRTGARQRRGTQCPRYKGNLTGFGRGALDLGSPFEKDPLQLKELIHQEHLTGKVPLILTGDAMKGVNARGYCVLMLMMMIMMILPVRNHQGHFGSYSTS